MYALLSVSISFFLDQDQNHALKFMKDSEHLII